MNKWCWDFDKGKLVIREDEDKDYEDFDDEEEAIEWFHEAMLRLAIGLYPLCGTPKKAFDNNRETLLKQAQDYVRSLEV